MSKSYQRHLFAKICSSMRGRRGAHDGKGGLNFVVGEEIGGGGGGIQQQWETMIHSFKIIISIKEISCFLNNKNL